MFDLHRLWGNKLVRVGLALMLIYLGIELASLLLSGSFIAQRLIDNVEKQLTKNALAVAKARWEGKNILGYRITVSLSNFMVNYNYLCSFIEDTITVVNGQVTDASHLSECRDTYDQITIEQMFERAERELEASNSTNEIDLEFDPDSGFVTRYMFRPYQSGTHPIVVTFSNLVVLEK